jgi:hypothetical protein
MADRLLVVVSQEWYQEAEGVLASASGANNVPPGGHNDR